MLGLLRVPVAELFSGSTIFFLGAARFSSAGFIRLLFQVASRRTSQPRSLRITCDAPRAEWPMCSVTEVTTSGLRRVASLLFIALQDIPDLWPGYRGER